MSNVPEQVQDRAPTPKPLFGWKYPISFTHINCDGNLQEWYLNKHKYTLTLSGAVLGGVEHNLKDNTIELTPRDCSDRRPDWGRGYTLHTPSATVTPGGISVDDPGRLASLQSIYNQSGHSASSNGRLNTLLWKGQPKL